MSAPLTNDAWALHPADLAALAAVAPARALVAELLAAEPSRDLYNACARLGALLAEHGASPTLAAGVLEGDAPPAARAALLEGYVGRVREDAHELALRAWGYPGCVVPLDGEPKTVAVTCFVPTDDAEHLADWAAALATRLARDCVKHVVLAGRVAAVTELKSALALLDITPAPAKRSFRWPWQR